MAAELSVAAREPLKTNRELVVATADNVLDFEFRKLGIGAKFLNDVSVLARCQPRVALRLRAHSNDHLS